MAYDPNDRVKRVRTDSYSPLVWGLLKRKIFNEELAERLKPLVEDYLKKLTR